MAGRGRAATLPAWMTAGQGAPGAAQDQMGGPQGGPPPQSSGWRPPMGQMGSGLPGPPPAMGGGLPQQGGYGPPGGWQPGQQQAPPPLQQQQARPPMMMGGPGGAQPPPQGMLPQHQQMPPQNLGGGPPPGLPYQGMPPAQQGYGQMPPRPGYGQMSVPGPMPPRAGPVSGATSYPGAMPRPMPQHMMSPGGMMMSPGQPPAPFPSAPFGAPRPAGTPPQPHQQAGGGPAWTEHTAPDGRKYYHNKATGKSSWEKPAELQSAKDRSEGASDWKEFTAPDGRKYYYNKATKESKWTLPDDLKRANEAAAANTGASSAAAKSSPGPVQVVKLEGATAGSATPSAAAVPNGAAAAAATAPVQAQASPLPASNSSTAATPDAQGTPGPFMYSTKEEAKDAFKELLVAVQVASDWSWDKTMRSIISDPRYSALKSLGEKKACFNEYVEQRKKEEVAETRARLRKARDEFTTMLEESADVKAATRFSKAATLFGDDPRWKAVPAAERETIYADVVKEKEKAERDARKAERRRRMAAFRTLLENTASIKVDTPWRKAQTKVEGEDEYEQLDKLDRLEVFQEYIRDLEKREKEAKEREKEERRRKERLNRDAFKELLQRHLAEGVLVARMRWKDYYPLVRKEPALAALEGNLAGSRPKELFEDALEAADAQFDKDRPALKKAVKEAEIAVEADTTFETFNAALEATDGVKGIIKPNRKLVFDELLERAKERLAKEEERRRAAHKEFTALLRETRGVTSASTWDGARASVEGAPEYKAVVEAEGEKKAEALFDEYMAHLKEREERIKERQREREREEAAEEAAEKHKKKRHKEKKEKHHRSERHDENSDKKHRSKSSKRHADDDGDDVEDKKSKRHKHDKDRRRRSSPARADASPEPAPAPADDAKPAPAPDATPAAAEPAASPPPPAAAAAAGTREPAEDGEL